MMNRTMKDSGVEWIGEIPENWKLVSVKYLFSIGRGRVIAKTELDDNGTYPVYSSQTKNNGVLGYINTYDYDVNQLTWTTDGANAGTVFLREGKYNCTNVCGTLLPQVSNISLRFMKYALEYIAIFHKRADTNGYKIMNNEMAVIKILLPPETEQQKIAAFLDEKVEHIDNIIEDTKQSIENLKAYKQSLITETVTKGLDKDVEMKDSGVEYIGEIPSHWNSSKLKYQLRSPLKYGANESGVDYDKHKPRYIRITDILENNKLTSTNRQSLDEDVAREYILKVGDLLFARSGATAGKTYMVTEETPRSAFAGYLIKGEVEDLNVSNYVYYYSLSKSYEEWKNSIVIQATIQNIGAEKYANMFLPIPPKDELVAIVKYLNKKSESIDLILNSKRRLLSGLEFYKKSIIYEYVTGKKEVK